VLSEKLVLAAPEGGSINGAPLEEGGLLLFPPGGVYEGWSPAGYRWVTAFLPKMEAQRLVRGAGIALPRLDGAAVLRSRVPRADVTALSTFAGDLGLERSRPAHFRSKGADASRGDTSHGWAHGPVLLRPSPGETCCGGGRVPPRSAGPCTCGPRSPRRAAHARHRSVGDWA
jgi:hypothetical protein